MLRNALAHARTRKLRWHALAVALGILVGLPLVAEVYETITIKKGDTLWAIAEKTLGNGSKYEAIFEANKPMLTHPDKIYPGQMLRIPK